MSHRKSIVRSHHPLSLQIALLIGASFSALAFAAPDNTPVSPAASKANSAASDEDSEVKEVVVVGSRIRRTNFDTPSPIKVVTREEATAAGFTSTTDLLQGAGVTGGSSQINNAFGNFVTDGGPGANTISLRGLGATRTLVMINGRRVAPAGTRGAVGSADLNVLPTAMIERVEVLRDGASSIYGSDAIGGVINVITMDKVEGINIEGESNLPTEGGGEQNRLSITGGASDDRWSISGSFDIYDRANLTVGERDWAKCAPNRLRDQETGESADYVDPTTGKAKCFNISLRGTHGVTINTIGTQTIKSSDWEDLGFVGPVVGAPGSTGTTFNRFRPNAAVTTGLVGYEGVGGGTNDLNVRDTFDPRMLDENIISPARIYTTFWQGSYDLQAMGNAKVYFELLGTRRESEQSSFRQAILDYRLGSPLIPDALSFSDILPPTDTTGDDDVGVRAFIGFGPDKSKQTVDFYKPTIGIKGDLEFLPEWKYDAYISYSTSDATYSQQSFLTDKLTYASDAIASGGGYDCAINATNPNEHCVPFPLLNAATVGGNLPQNFKDYIFRTVGGKTKYDETVFSVVFDGPLYQLPAGKLQGVLGLEHRQEKINDQPDPDSVAGNLYNLTSAAPTKGDDSVSEIYTEIEIPVLANVSMAKELTINGSYRYTDYDSYGSDDTYKIGFVYAPVKWLSFRATKGTSFRAPALFEQFQGATTGFLSSSDDPCNGYDEGGVDANIAANCALDLNNEPEFQNKNGVKVINAGGAAAGLFAETSENTTYGVIFEPVISDTTELSFAVDYFDIQIDNGVQQAGDTEILGRCYASANDFKDHTGLCRLVSRDPADKSLTVLDSYTNLSTEISKGWDFDARVQQEIGAGKLLVNLSATHYTSQKSKIFKEDPLLEQNGWFEMPKWSGTGDISYSINSWRFTYGVEWIGEMEGYTYVEEDPKDSPHDYAVGDYFEHRISVQYSTDAWEATVGVRNLTNKTPEAISAGNYDRMGSSLLYSGYDYVGREVFLNMQYHFK